MYGNENWGTSLGFQQLSVTSTATALTVPNGTTGIVFSVDTNNARWRGDGTDPTASIGVQAKTTDSPTYYRGNPKGLKFISETGTSTINAAFYGFEFP